MADQNARNINHFMIGVVLVVGQILAFIRYEGMTAESGGYGVGIVALPLIAHFWIAKLDSDHKENMRKLLRAGIIDAILIGIIAFV